MPVRARPGRAAQRHGRSDEALQHGQVDVIGTRPELTVVTEVTRDQFGGGLRTEPWDGAEGLAPGALLDPASLDEDPLRRRQGR